MKNIQTAKTVRYSHKFQKRALAGAASQSFAWVAGSDDVAGVHDAGERDAVGDYCTEGEVPDFVRIVAAHRIGVALRTDHFGSFAANSDSCRNHCNFV